MALHLKRLFKLHKLMNEANDGTNGDSGGGGGTGSEGEGGGGEGDGSKPTPTGGDANASNGSKPTDAEAKLLKEVMEKKTKLKEAQDQLTQVNAKLKEFEGLDPAEIKQLVAEQKAAKEKQLEAKGEWDALKKQMNDQHQAELNKVLEQVRAKEATEVTLKSQIAELTVGSAFAQSKFISEEVTLTPAKARIVYGSHFEFDGSTVVAYDKPAGAANRTPLVDAKGDPLGFEAALRKIVEADPDRDQILRGKGKPGAGSRSDQRGPAPNPAREVTSRDKIAAGLAKLKIE